MGALVSSLADATGCLLGATLLPVLEVLADVLGALFSALADCLGGTATCLGALVSCACFARRDTIHTTGAVYM